MFSGGITAFRAAAGCAFLDFSRRRRFVFDTMLMQPIPPVVFFDGLNGRLGQFKTTWIGCTEAVI